MTRARQRRDPNRGSPSGDAMHGNSAVLRVAMLAALGSLSIPAYAQVPGGGPTNTDCYVEWSGITPNNGKNLACHDGDPSCDVDGISNGICILGVGVCEIGRAHV